jgi:thiamine biosynthesis lipoprotein
VINKKVAQQTLKNIDSVVNMSSAISNLHRFAHKAMATIYEIFIVNDDAGYAQQAAHEAFAELDRLEQELSRFLPNSDIARLNQLAANQPLRLGLDAFECLKLSKRISEETNGAFDVTIGPLMKCWQNPDKTLRSPSEEELAEARRNIGMRLLDLDGAQHTVTLQASPVHIDLGAIGKGYAVDVMASLLREWDVGMALIHGGRSSVFALGSPPEKAGWPLTISNPMNGAQILARFHLRNQAVSGSGLQKGQHIINPRTGQPLSGKRATWAIAPDAATSDAVSTAFMIMPTNEIEEYCRNHSDVQAMVIWANEGREAVWQCGAWGAGMTMDKFISAESILQP